MLQGRGGGYGLDKHIHDKKQASYDTALEGQVKRWISDVTGIPWGPQSFGDRLHDGQMLCSLANAIQPGKVRVNNSSMPFKQMENISAFLRACRDFGVREYDLFETVDLYEQKDLGVVLQCIASLGRAVQNLPGYRGPAFGPREATKNTRNFSPSEQKEQSRKAGLYGSKQTMGSSAVMERSHVSTSNDITFGSSTSGSSSNNNVVSRQNMGSSSTMERTHYVNSNDITFGHNMSSSKPTNSYRPGPPSPKKSSPSPPPRTTTTTTTTTTTWSSPPSTYSSSQSSSFSSPQSKSPSEGRGGGYGLDKHIHDKKQASYDTALEGQVKRWISDVTGIPWGPQSFGDRLHDGQMLCSLANAIQPGKVRVNNSSMPFKQMENISAFLRACRDFGVREYDLFETVDLYEQKDLGVVLQCIASLGRAVQNLPGYRGPAFGPREATKNTRNFSPTQQKEQSRKAGLYGSKQTMGSSAVMERSHVSTSNDITFGSSTSGSSSNNNVVSRQNMGSHGIMERSHVSRSNDITFGSSTSGNSSNNNVVSQQNMGSSGTMERTHYVNSNDITFGHNMSRK